MKILKGLLMIITAPVILVLTLFCLALHGADLHIRSGARPVQYRDCSAWCGCAAYLFPAEWCDSAGHGIFDQPMGLPLAAIWLMGKVQSLKFAIQELVYG